MNFLGEVFLRDQIINPYNFISFGEDIKSNRKTREDVYRQNSSLVSGWLDVTLIPSTPLIIPDGAHPIYIDTRSKKVVPNPKEYRSDKDLSLQTYCYPQPAESKA